jgi:hypothetical protein
MACVLSFFLTISHGAELAGNSPGIDAKVPAFLIAAQGASTAAPVIGAFDQIEQEVLRENNNPRSIVNTVLWTILFATITGLVIVISLHVKQIKKQGRPRRRRRRSVESSAGNLDPA